MTDEFPATDEELVRRLLRDQHPDLAGASIRLVDVGWDNDIYRLGEHHVARLPRRHEAIPLVAHEQTWLPILAERLPILISSPVRLGVPTSYFPWRWSIVPWFSGETADLSPPSPDQAPRLAEFLRALHQPAPANAPHNPFRGVPLSERAEKVEGRLEQLRNTTNVVTANVLEIWQRALNAPKSRETSWLHGDLHARNVVVSDGIISGIVDWGDITSGDAATDLASVWMLFDDPITRTACLDQYQASPDMRDRAAGWAVFFATGLLETGLVDHPQHAAIGETTLRRLDAEDL